MPSLDISFFEAEGMASFCIGVKLYGNMRLPERVPDGIDVIVLVLQKERRGAWAVM